jgi:hypothetical protein
MELVTLLVYFTAPKQEYVYIYIYIDIDYIQSCLLKSKGPNIPIRKVRELPRAVSTLKKVSDYVTWKYLKIKLNLWQ